MMQNWIKENNILIKRIVFIRKMVGSIKPSMYTAHCSPRFHGIGYCENNSATTRETKIC